MQLRPAARWRRICCSREAIFGEHGLEGEPYPADTPIQAPAGPLTPDFHHGNKLGTRGRIKSVRTRDWKLVHYPGQPYGELYDLRADPGELRNLYGQPQHQAVVQRRCACGCWIG